MNPLLTTPEETAIRSALRALARAEAAVEPPERLDAAVMAAWDAEHARSGEMPVVEAALPSVRDDVGVSGPSPAAGRQGRSVAPAFATAAGLVLAAAWAIQRAAAPLDVPALPAAPAGVFAAVPSATLDPPATTAPAVEIAARPASDATPSSELLLLVGAPIADGETVRMVRMRIPAATLAALGVRATADDFAHEAVDLDVLVGEDGVARAITVGM